MQTATQYRTRLFVAALLLTTACGEGNNENAETSPPKNETPAPLEAKADEPPLPAAAAPTESKTAPHVKELTSHDWRLRKEAAEQLGMMGEEAKDAIPSLVKALEDKDEEVRKTVLRALGKIGSKAHTAAASIVQSLEDEDEKVRSTAVETLAKLGPVAVPPIARLIERTLDAASISPSSAIELPEAEWRSLAKAAIALREIGPGAADALNAAMKLANIECGDAREVPSCYVAQGAAADALGRFGPDAVPALIGTLRDKNPKLRRFAAAALGKIGPDAAQAVPALVALLGDDKSSVSRAAAGALGRIGSPAIPALLESLHDIRPAIRMPAVKALIRMGPAAKEAVPELQKMLNDEKKWTRRAAKDVLAKI